MRPSKKIISFSLWGDNHSYIAGAIANARLAPAIYPGWQCRFYCDPRVPTGAQDELMGLGAEIVAKPESDGFAGLYWRFEAMYDDPTVDRFIIRDTDSRLTPREADAVQEWIESGLPFHCMRDNPAHNIQILGGMWGSRTFIIPEFKQLLADWVSDLKVDPANPKGKYHGSDQVFLCSVIWPYIKSCHMAHDEYFQYTGRERPFRIKLKRDGYVGMIYSDKDADRCEAL